MSDRRTPLFLGKLSYRQRRLADAARLLPVFGAVLMALPLLWPRDDAPGTPTTSAAMIYIFGVWCLLTVVSALLARWLDPDPAPPDEAGMRDGPADRGL